MVGVNVGGLNEPFDVNPDVIVAGLYGLKRDALVGLVSVGDKFVVENRSTTFAMDLAVTVDVFSLETLVLELEKIELKFDEFAKELCAVL